MGFDMHRNINDQRLRRFQSRQRGAALLVALLMLVAVAMLGISAAQISMQGEKASRNDRDHQTAFQAAEAALMDAEMDIENSSYKDSRSAQFGPRSREGFAPGCGAGSANVNLGLCEAAPEGAIPIWLTVDFLDESSGERTVPYGRFTGQTFQTKKGSLPARPPRYIIEALQYTKAAEDASDPTVFYRITAIGFGTRDTTQVVLQTFYRKDD